MNDLRPVALTLIIMKTIGRIVENLLNAQVVTFEDNLQFAYKDLKKGVEDVVTTLLHTLVTHLINTKPMPMLGCFLYSFLVLSTLFSLIS